MNQALQVQTTDQAVVNAPVQSQVSRPFQSRNPRYAKPEREIKSRRRIVKDNQIWDSKDSKTSIKVVEQTRYHRRIAWFNVRELNEKGQFIYEEPDELNEDQILKNYKMHKNYETTRR